MSHKNRLYQDIVNFLHLVKDAKANGNKLGIGNKNRLTLTLFIQHQVQAFHNMPETQQSKTPRDWCDRVEQMMNHFRGQHENCGILDRFFGLKTLILRDTILMSDPYKLKYQTLIRCLEYNEGSKSVPVFDQLMKNDAKSGKKLTDDLCKKLTDLLIGDEKCDMASIICDMGSTSAVESNHGRIVTRNIHIKGLTFFDLHLTFI